MKKARVIYNEHEDAYDIEILIDGEWGLCTRYPCHASTKNPMGDADYISFRILKEIVHLQNIGYSISYNV